ncbi:MAG TPA: HlyD family efflux transporter periplasmic adaptor subunit [Phycisphaerae bacterium]|nr:HlyD family efflux transporter periplasmic adaptor subunit [Phycisphaerae bacterium]
MKRFIIAVVVVGLLGGAYFYVRQYGGVSLGFLEGKSEVARLGDMVRPITASGKIEPASIVQIKGKASGEVVETPFKDGATVRKGDLILRLDPIDEQRNVDRAQSDYDRAEIALKNAQLSLDEREKVGVPAAKAKKTQSEARLTLARLEFENQQRLKEIRQTSDLDVAAPREYEEAKARFAEATSAVDLSNVEITQASLAVDLARQDVEAARKALETAQKVLEETQQRLRETKVYSPIDGMVLVRHVQIGEVVQSGKTSLTGGTVLMEIADVDNLYAVVNVDEADIGDVREVAPPSAVPGYTGARPNHPATEAAPASQEAPLATLPADTFDLTEKVRVTVESFPQEEFFGTIERIAPQSQLVQAIATFKVWIQIASENRDKLVGLLNTQAEAHFKVRSVSNAVLVSCDAIMTDSGSDRSGVYLVIEEPDTKRRWYKFQPCQFGISDGLDVEVIEGLKAGQAIWTQLPLQTDKEKQAAEEAKAKKKR